MKDTVGNVADVCRREESRMWHRFGVEPTLQGFWRNAHIEKDEQDEENWSMLFQKLEILSGSYSPTFCLGTSSRTCQGAFREQQRVRSFIKISICLLSANPSNVFHSHFVFLVFFILCLTTFRRRWNHLDLESSCLRRARLLHSSLVFLQNLEETNSKVWDICFWVLFFLFVRTFPLNVFQNFSSRDILAIKTNFWIERAGQWNRPIIAHVLTER